MSGAADVAQSLLNVVSDPCLVTVAQQLNELHLLESSGSGGPTQAAAGIGLCYAVAPLKVVVWAKQNPWIFAVAAGAVVLGIGTVGYKVGKRIHGGSSSKAVAGLKDVWHDYFHKGFTASKAGKYAEPDHRYREAYKAGWAYGKKRGVAGL